MTADASVRQCGIRFGAARLLTGLLAAALFPLLCEAAQHQDLSLEQRVAAQRAIEQVYWNHRLWPKENPGPKPSLSAVLPDAAIRARVEDTLRKSNALEKYWHRPITAEQLQAELNRMAAHTRDPRLLQELFAALGNDPRLIAETLARQALVDRLIRNWYATDERFHGALKRKAEAALATCHSVKCMPSMGGEYRDTTLKVKAPATEKPDSASHRDVVRLEEEEWKEQLEGLAGRLGGRVELLPMGKLSALEETPEAFIVTAVLSQRKDEVRTATVTWPKVSFDEWWRTERGSLGTQAADLSKGFTLPATASSGCAVDTWAVLGSPHWRYGHTAVWTGTEMIIWGGYGGGNLNTGGRYDPSTDTWTPTSTGANVPAPRYDHTAVWTGTEMIVWSGSVGSGYLNTGGRYSPANDSWTPTSTSAVPTARYSHSAVWTGTQMIVWGGESIDAVLNTGGRYDPSTDTWTPTSTGANVPTVRRNHTAMWTGTEMIVWGGNGSIYFFPLNTGARYDPSTDTWMPTSTGANVPAPRHGHTAVWTGTEMIVWGSSSDTSGGRYNPITDTWTPTSTGANVPAARGGHTAVWTGTEMIVWGGNGGSYLNTGGRYDPSTDTWTPTSTGANVPTARILHTAVWTGTEMIIWGGYDDVNALSSGGRYDPVTDAWAPTSTGANIPSARLYHTAVWTGTEMIIWGGYDGGYLSSGGRYDPVTDAWAPTSSGANVPSARLYHTAVWTGTEMIIWGGYGGGNLNTGARYDPVTDAWAPTSTGANVPSARLYHTAVWTGTEMIVWGGYDGGYLNTGGRYDPSTDTWTPTSTGANVPAPRYGHSGVWTGTEMTIWGGYDGAYLNSGGRYDPVTGAWTPTSTGTNVPTACHSHTALWTGTEMIVWGGISSCTFDDFGNEYCTRNATGGRYNPTTNTWIPTPLGPEARSSHSAIWTGTEMIVWGGTDASCGYECCNPEFCSICLLCTDIRLSSGGRYDPYSDTWAPTSTGANVPDSRSNHGTVWTGTEMIIWGGINYAGVANDDGGLYCACPNGTLYYRDADGDGYGDAAVVGTSCDGTIPAGYVANQIDCNDASASVNPGALEICNAVDDDCNGSVDDATLPGSVAAVTMSGDVESIEWAPLAVAQTYDLVYGDVAQLRSTGGDFTPATLGCLAHDTAATTAVFSTVPQIGQAFWGLVRGHNCVGNGTYDSGDPGQVGSRDAEIAASLFSCGYPAVCGDGACNGTENCGTCSVDCGSCVDCTADEDCIPSDCCHATSCNPVWQGQTCGGICNGQCQPFTLDCGQGYCACQQGQCIAIIF